MCYLKETKLNQYKWRDSSLLKTGWEDEVSFSRTKINPGDNTLLWLSLSYYWLPAVFSNVYKGILPFYVVLEEINREGNGTPLQYSCLGNPMDGGGYSPWGHEESDTTERLHFHFSLSCTGEGNGNPLQYCCLENPRDRGAWWAAVYGVAQSRTRLKRLSSSSTESEARKKNTNTVY